MALTVQSNTTGKLALGQAGRLIQFVSAKFTTTDTSGDIETSLTVIESVHITLTGSVARVTATASGATLAGGGTGVKATGTVTIAGTVTTGNIVTVTVDGTAVSYTVTPFDDTAAKIATKVAAALNANGTFAAGFLALVAGAVVTVRYETTGTGGNAKTLVAAVAGQLPGTDEQVFGPIIPASGQFTVPPSGKFPIFRRATSPTSGLVVCVTVTGW